MRKLILFMLLIIASVNVAQAQNHQRQGNTYKTVSGATASKETRTNFIWETSKGEQYNIYVGPTGSCYIKRTSSKTGKEYKQYLGEDVSKDVCKSLGIEYKSKNK